MEPEMQVTATLLDEFADDLVDQWEGSVAGDMSDSTVPGAPLPPWHCYSITRHWCWNTWRARNSDTPALTGPAASRTRHWWCANLAQAEKHYSWEAPGAREDFASLSSKLQGAITEGNLSGAAEACSSIFRWGSVGRGRPGKPAASRIWLLEGEERGTLISDLKDAVAALQPDSLPGKVRCIFSMVPMNSATTKLFAAADPLGKVAIFDGRVAAAASLLAKRFLQKRGDVKVPPELHFGWGPPGTEPTSTRDPSDSTYRFRNLNNMKDVERAECNWRLNRVVERMSGRLSLPVRRIEKALFMVGYKV